jgi:hypothetical protein
VNDRVVGALVLVGSLGVALLYAWWLLFSPWGYYALVSLALVTVLGISGITTWIGYTIVTTPTPPPLEEFIEEEKEAQTQGVMKEGV